MSSRRKSKKRSAEVRNSLRLFGLLAVLAGVNVYVFFFNRGTAPREILKPSSTVNGADGKAGVLHEAVQQEARVADRDQPLGAASPAGGATPQAAQGRLPGTSPKDGPAATPRPRAPQVLGPAPSGAVGASAAGARADVPRGGQVAVAPKKVTWGEPGVGRGGGAQAAKQSNKRIANQPGHQPGKPGNTGTTGKTAAAGATGKTAASGKAAATGTPDRGRGHVANPSP